MPAAEADIERERERATATCDRAERHLFEKFAASLARSPCFLAMATGGREPARSAARSARPALSKTRRLTTIQLPFPRGLSPPV